jgi:hypothetical protein
VRNYAAGHFKLVINASTLQRLFLLRMADDILMMDSPKPVTASTSPEETLCGRRIRIDRFKHKSAATLGGLVATQTNGLVILWGMTSAHAFDRLEHGTVVDLSPRQVDETDDDADDILVARSLEVSAPMEIPLPAFDVGDSGFASLGRLVRMANPCSRRPNYDWAILEIEPGLTRPNLAGKSPIELRGDPDISNPPEEGDDVFVLRPDGEMLKGRIERGTSSLLLAPAQTLMETFEVFLSGSDSMFTAPVSMPNLHAQA